MGGHSKWGYLGALLFFTSILISMLFLPHPDEVKDNEIKPMSTSLEQIESEMTTVEQTIEVRPPPDLWSYSTIADPVCWHPPDPSSYIRPDLVSPWIDSDFTVNVFSDWQMHNREDYWQNPDYTLNYGRGDCEDWAIAYCSVYRAKGYDAVVVIGYRAGLLHAWCEFYDPKTSEAYWVRDIYNVFPRDSSSYHGLMMFSDRMKWQCYKHSWNAP